MSTYSTLKQRDQVSPRTWASIVRNCRSYMQRHNLTESCEDARWYVHNLAGLHRVDERDVWHGILYDAR